MKLKLGSWSLTPFIVAIALVGLQACGGGGSSTSTDTTTQITTDQDASGIYNGTATVDVNTDITDLRGMVYNNNFMFFSETATPHILYQGTITSITLDDYTATVDVYENGTKTQTAVPVTGKVVSATSITGTIGTDGDAGNHNGTFSLTYDSVYERGATVERIEASGLDKATGTTYGVFDFFGSHTFLTDLTFTVLSTSGGIYTCSIIDTYSIPDTAVNIFSFNDMTILEDASCLDSYEGTGYSGMATVIDDAIDGTNSRILIAYTNGMNSVFGKLTKLSY